MSMFFIKMKNHLKIKEIKKANIIREVKAEKEKEVEADRIEIKNLINID